MSARVTPELIREQGAQLRRLSLDDKRAAELAEEVARLNDAVMNAADQRLDFNDDPNRFAALLNSAAQPARIVK
jgi:hypothetical protein